MATIDIIVCVIALVAAVTGAMKGFMRQAAAVAGLVGAIIICHLFGGTVADMVVAPDSEHAALWRAIVYIGLFVVVMTCAALVGRLCGAVLSAVKLRFFDRVAGAVFRTGLWLLFVSIVLNLWLAASPAKAGAVLNDNAHPHRGWLVKFAPATLGYIASQTASNIEAS